MIRVKRSSLHSEGVLTMRELSSRERGTPTNSYHPAINTNNNSNNTSNNSGSNNNSNNNNNNNNNNNKNRGSSAMRILTEEEIDQENENFMDA